MENKGFKLSKNSKSILAIIALFVLIAFAYFPALLEGREISAGDLSMHEGMSKEICDYRDNTGGEEPLWTNRAFGGMPSYLISTLYPGNLVEKAKAWFYFIPRPASYLILSFSFFFVLGICFGATPWLAFAGALAYGFSTFVFVVFHAGHATKVHALCFMALVVAGVIFAYRKNRYWGSTIAAIGLSWMIAANHPQMTYYAGLMILIIGLAYLIYAIKEHQLNPFFKTSALLVLAAVLAVGTNFSRLYTTYEYGKYSMRGPSDLSSEDTNQTTGLDKDYILGYSYDLGEAMTAFIPRFKGGGMSEDVGENSNLYKALEPLQGKANARKTVQSIPLYWGSQPISSAPFYFGAILCFLFVFGLFVLKGKDKCWLVATVIVAFLLSLGKNIPFLANFMVDYFPMYNKFRDVKNIIVIEQFAMAVIGLLALKEVYLRSIEKKRFYRALKWSFGIAGGLSLLFFLIPSLAGNFKGSSDVQLAQYWPQQLLDALELDRKHVLRVDAFRTFVFVSLAAVTLWAFWEKKLKPAYAMVIWSVLTIADLWPIDKKYLNDDDFVAKQRSKAIEKTLASDYILKDKSLDFRVLNMSVSTFNDATTSYFHNSIGGYSGAKMRRYQDLIEQHISPEMAELSQRMQKIESQEQMIHLFDGLTAINMLNTKYLIYRGDAAPLPNPRALGNAWFVPSVRFVANADEEIEALNHVNIQNEVLIDKAFESEVATSEFAVDSTSMIVMKSYEPNRLLYETRSETAQMAVFSEIYYPKGWVAKIDGKEMPYVRANYVLRAMPIPAGEHEVEFVFSPDSYHIGNKVAYASSILLFIAVAGLVFVEFRKKQK